MVDLHEQLAEATAKRTQYDSNPFLHAYYEGRTEGLLLLISGNIRCIERAINESLQQCDCLSFHKGRYDTLVAKR